MSRKDFLKMGGLGMAGGALATTLRGVLGRGGIAPADAATNSVALGAYTPSLPWGFEQESCDIDAFAELVGRMPTVMHWFQDWADVPNFESGYVDAAVSRGAMPLITWEPWDFRNAGSLDQPGYSLREILDGSHDEYIRRWARDAAAWGDTFYLRFAHEMNGDWTTWSPGVNSNTAGEFVAMWRKVHTMFRQEGATNVRWVWAPVAHYEGATPFRAVYPGDAYVDWLGLSGYNWGDTRDWSRWQGFGGIFGESYEQMVALTNKRIIVAEVASAESGGDKAAWIRQAYLRQIPERFPRIKALVWFHVRKENDWRANSSPSSLRAYREVVASTRYGGRLPA